MKKLSHTIDSFIIRIYFWFFDYQLGIKKLKAVSQYIQIKQEFREQTFASRSSFMSFFFSEHCCRGYPPAECVSAGPGTDRVTFSCQSSIQSPTKNAYVFVWLIINYISNLTDSLQVNFVINTYNGYLYIPWYLYTSQQHCPKQTLLLLLLIPVQWPEDIYRFTSADSEISILFSDFQPVYIYLVKISKLLGHWHLPDKKPVNIMMIHLIHSILPLSLWRQDLSLQLEWQRATVQPHLTVGLRFSLHGIS